MISRRAFLGSIFAAGVAPAIIRLPGVLMPIKATPVILTPSFSGLAWPGVYRWFSDVAVASALEAGWELTTSGFVDPTMYRGVNLMRIKK